MKRSILAMITSICAIIIVCSIGRNALGDGGGAPGNQFITVQSIVTKSMSTGIVAVLGSAMAQLDPEGGGFRTNQTDGQTQSAIY